MKKTNPLYVSYAGPNLLNTPLLNKGNAFSEQERDMFNLRGLIPSNIEDLDAQEKRCYKQFRLFHSSMARHIYLRNIQDTNETLFYKLLHNHLEEMMPIIYTPTVGEACERFSEIYRKARGLFISYKDVDKTYDMLMNVTKSNIKVIVITDGERILGLGDQGIGGMGIPIGKLSLYTACGGISPANTLPITLDVGTNNQNLIDNPIYMGLHENRIDDESYYSFIDQVLKAINKRYENVLIQFEDFASFKAQKLLQRYRNQYCCFNDDIQGTAAVTVATLISACRLKKQMMKNQRVLFIGAGSAGCGIASLLLERMKSQGLSENEALNQIYLSDSHGLICRDNHAHYDYQKRFERTEDLSHWKTGSRIPNLLDIIKNGKITAIVGVSGQAKIITEAMVNQMMQFTDRPIIFPLSNPNSKLEAEPKDLITWSKGTAIIATGSPIDPFINEGKEYTISQCNNSYIFPGFGLAVIAAKIKHISDEMLMASSVALSDFSMTSLADDSTELLPGFEHIHTISKKIAFNIAKCAIDQGYAKAMDDQELSAKIEKIFWLPHYRQYRRKTT